MTIAVEDFRELSRARLPRFLFDYIDGGAYQEITLRRNADELSAVPLRQRVLVANPAPELGCELLGSALAAPIVLAPIGLAGLYARRGETQAFGAAADAGIPFTLSALSVCPLEEVRAVSPGDLWLQLYMVRDRAFLKDLLARARAQRCSTLVLTVDMSVPATRYRDYRSGLAGAPGWRGSVRRGWQAMQRPGWAWSVGLRGRPHVLGNVAPMLQGRSGLEDFFAWMRSNFDPTVDWDALDWIRAQWPGRLVLKGIMDPADARLAAAQGVDAIVVSNHGGRQLDGAPSTACALPQIADSVGSALPILVDGGVRSGVDIVRMLGLGAKAVMVGRPWAWALAAQGREGVRSLLDNLMAEMRVAMVMTGCRDVAGIDRRVIDPSFRWASHEW